VTSDADAGGAIPAENPPASSVTQAAPDYAYIRNSLDNIQAGLSAYLGIMSQMGQQINWICQTVQAVSQSMPPFMRGAIPNVQPPGFPTPGHPASYHGQH
jgi:hypothetical protein